MQEKKIVGFTQGTFDMFHVGHLNLLKNAKKKCDYLIVGVNSDELVQNYKNKKTVVPIEERAQIVEAIRYVDQVVVTDSLDKMDAWEKNKYDLLFIGSDWKGSDRWNKTEEEMKKVGVTVEYLPYTQTTNSTLLREKLLNK